MEIRPVAAVLALLSSGGCFGSGCNAPTGPITLTCESPGAATLSLIEIGATDPSNNDPSLDAPPADSFIPYAEGATVPIVEGGQGLTMIVLRLRYTGMASACIGGTLTITGTDGTLLTSLTKPLAAVKDSAGRWVTGDIYAPASYPDTVIAKVSAGGAALTRTLHPSFLSTVGCSGFRACAQGCEITGGCDGQMCGTLLPSSAAFYDALIACQRRACATPMMSDMMPMSDMISDGGGMMADMMTMSDMMILSDMMAPRCADPSSSACALCLGATLAAPSDCDAADPVCGACANEQHDCEIH